MATPAFSVYADEENHQSQFEGFARPAKKVLAAKERAGLQDSGQKFPKAKQPTSFSSSRKQPSSTGSLAHPLAKRVIVPSEDSINSTLSSENGNKTRSSSLESSSSNFDKYQQKLSERRLEIAALVEKILNDHPDEILTVPEMGMEPDMDADIGLWIFPEEHREAELEAMRDKKPLRLRGLRDVSNMDVVEEEIDIPLPFIEDC
ncbi:hypothetical protein RvY_00614 [Ramazzottius varieornatus]|uniref:Uncharacterized protein n=1 Tax=Ramazzottius varieornatus TaxID=947166 RepID=A0A1D1UKM0_RAMVA|nr:hypothetical protein RvY_00614 [Ramazzottius varieornatus]